MKIRCEKCGVQLDLAGYVGRTDVLTVKCTQCGHLIRGVELTSESAVTQDMLTESWRIRRQNGDVLAFDGLKTLRRWINEGRVGANDDVSADGRSWRPLSTLMDDPQLDLEQSKPKGPPPIPPTVFPIPDKTLDAPDPEEELDASLLSVDDGTVPHDALARRDLSAPLPRAVAAPLRNSGSEAGSPGVALGPMSTATGFVPLPSTAPDADEHGGALYDMTTGRFAVSEEQQESLRTLDDQPTLRYTGQTPVASETNSEHVDDLEEPSLEQAVDHLVTSDHLQSLKIDSLTFADDREDTPNDHLARPSQGGRMGAFVAGVFLALLLGGAGLYYAGFIKAPTDKPIEQGVAEQKSEVTQVQLQQFAQAVSSSRSGNEATRKQALVTYGTLLRELEGAAGARSFKASIHMERARSYLALVRAQVSQGKRAKSADLNTAASALSTSRSLNGNPKAGLLIQSELLAFRGQHSDAKRLVEAASEEGVDKSLIDALRERLSGMTNKSNTGAVASPKEQAGDVSGNGKPTSGSSKRPTDDGALKKQNRAADGSKASPRARSVTLLRRLDESQEEYEKRLTGRSPSTRQAPESVLDGLIPNPSQTDASSKKKKNETSAKKKPTPTSSITKRVDFDGSMKRGYQQLERGRVTKAREAFLRAAQARPDRPEPHANLGWCAIESRKYDGAIRYFRKALSVRKRYSDGLFGLGVAYEKKGNTRKAVDAFTEYLEHHPNGRKARMIKVRLDRLKP